MTFAEFESTISPLREKFGKNAFDTAKLNFIFEEVKFLQVNQFKGIVNFFIGEDIKAKVSDFVTAARRFQNAGRTHSCPDCEGSGWILRDNPDSPIPWAIRCRCSGGTDSLLKYLKREGDIHTLNRLDPQEHNIPNPMNFMNSMPGVDE